MAAYERYLADHWADRHHFQWYHPNDPFLRAYIHERLAGLYEDAGRVQDARRHLSAFIRQWDGADAALQPRVRAARARLQALSSEG